MGTVSSSNYWNTNLALGVYGRDLYIGGYVDYTDEWYCFFTYWNDTSFTYPPTMTGGIVPSGYPPSINAFAVYDNNLFVGGNFDTAGGIPANFIAQWNNPLGINSITKDNNEIKLYPNPNNGVFTIQLNSIQSIANSQIEIYNLLGEKIYTETLRQAQGDNTINLSDQPSGIYLYRITSDKGEAIGSGKVIIN